MSEGQTVTSTTASRRDTGSVRITVSADLVEYLGIEDGETLMLVAHENEIRLRRMQDFLD